MEDVCIEYLASRSIPVSKSDKTVGSDHGGRVKLLPNELAAISYLMDCKYTLKKYPQIKGINC